jgi:hypothetical protein
MAKKKTKKRTPLVVKFYDLRLTLEDIDHLRWVLDMDCKFQEDCMKQPHPSSATPEEKLQDWVIARDGLVQSLKVIQMIDRVYKPKKGVRHG